MFTKILVANRGEIALRVIRACREMGIASVAVYSDADARAPHVREADEAIRIGEPPSAESYLKGERIIEVAQRVGAQAIHPGYGFLSEREWFSRAVRDAGLVFIGPPPEAIAAMGNKTAARQLAIKANVPVVPGTTEALRDANEARAVAEQFGYPVLLKAAAGGGGKGMRVVREPREMDAALDTARREAKGAFGDDAVYVEKYIVGPRHVEIQVLGDQHGTMLSLNERECSVQRRHQKMIEEAPSVAVTPELRRAMGDTAVRAASAAGYVNAGTCEFLLDAQGSFYFLEMNTRLQVEHPVTELVTGIDLVQWQIRIAAGERLPFKQADIVPRGWAIECRITSEDPANGFLPSTGRISYLHLPSGPGVRWDGGIEVGSEIGLYYDPMLAKLIVHAPTREAAIARMHRALLELTIEGVESSRDFHLRVMEDAEFRAGAIEIQWLERRLDSILGVKPPAETAKTAALVAALIADRDRQSPKRASSGPASSGRANEQPNDPQSEQQSGWLRAARSEALR
jgi:acetyl-CoA carboxylase, biotin carboxylase subunit